MIPFSDEELYPAVMQVLNTVRPMLLGDGGDMKLLKIKDGVVFIQLQGACHGCSASDVTLKYGIQKELRIQIHPEMSVVNIPIGEEQLMDNY